MCVCACSCACVYVIVCVYVHVCMYVCMCVYVHVCMCVYALTVINTLPYLTIKLLTAVITEVYHIKFCYSLSVTFTVVLYLSARLNSPSEAPLRYALCPQIIDVHASLLPEKVYITSLFLSSTYEETLNQL